MNDFAKDGVYVWSGQPSTFKGYVDRCNIGKRRWGRKGVTIRRPRNGDGMCVVDDFENWTHPYICENRKSLELKAKT